MIYALLVENEKLLTLQATPHFAIFRGSKQGEVTMGQPKWKLVGNNGDVSPFEHGGELVFKDLTGQYDPELEIIQPVDLFTIDDKPATYIARVCIPKPDNDDWFMDELSSIASYIGQTEEELKDMLMSDNLLIRARGYKAIVDYWGPENLGSGDWELELVSDLKRKYGKLKNL